MSESYYSFHSPPSLQFLALLCYYDRLMQLRLWREWRKDYARFYRHSI